MSNQSANKKRKSETFQLATVEDIGKGNLSLAPHLLNLPHPRVLNTCLTSVDGQQLKNSMGSVGDFLRHLESNFKQACRQQGVNPWPIGEESILSALLSLRHRGINLVSATKHMAKTCESTAGPKSKDDTFPKEVLYPQRCQGVCGALGLARISMQTKIIVSLNTLAATRYAKPTDMVKDDLLLSFTVTSHGLQEKMIFCLVTAVAFRGGVQKPTQSYVKLCPSDSFGADSLLHLVPLNFVEPKRHWPSPFSSAFTGAVETWSTSQLAAYLIGTDDDCSQMTIVVQKHVYADISRVTLKVTGVANDWTPIEFDNHKAFDAKVSRRAKSKSDKSPDTVTTPSGAIDMLDFFSTADEHETSPAATEAHTRVSGELMDALDLGDDEGDGEMAGHPKWQRDFEGLLDPDQLEVLREAEASMTMTPTKSNNSDSRFVHFYLQTLLVVFCFAVTVTVEWIT